MPVLGTILNYLGTTAEIDRLNAGTALTQIETQLGQQRLDAEKKQIEAQQRFAAATSQQNITESVMRNDKSATSINDAMADNDSASLQRLSREEKNLSERLDLARKPEYYGLVDTKEIESQLKDVRAEKDKLTKTLRDNEAKNKYEIGSEAMNVSDAEGVKDLLTNIANNPSLGVKAANDLSRRLPRDRDGNLLFNEATQRVLGQFAAPMIGAKDKAAIENFKSEIQDRRNKIAIREQELIEKARVDNATIASKQAGVDEKEAKFEDSELVSYGSMVAAGVPVATAVPGWGTLGTKQRKMVMDEAFRQIAAEQPELSDPYSSLSEKEKNIKVGQILAQRGIDYAGGKASGVQLAKMEGATRQAVKQLDYNAQKAEEMMEGMNSSDLSPVFNAVARKAEKWTGDPKYNALFFYVESTAMESARLQSAGQASIAQLHAKAAETAQQWANMNMTPSQWKEMRKAVVAEGQRKIETYDEARNESAIGPRTSKSDSNVQSMAKSAWGSYDPDAYEYRIDPQSGKIQRRKK